MNDKTALGTVGKAAGGSKVWGILMLICGVLAISLPTLPTYVR